MGRDTGNGDRMRLYTRLPFVRLAAHFHPPDITSRAHFPAHFLDSPHLLHHIVVISHLQTGRNQSRLRALRKASAPSPCTRARHMHSTRRERCGGSLSTLLTEGEQ